jgi:hypothetical protein
MGRGGVRHAHGARWRSSMVRGGRRRVVDDDPPVVEEGEWLWLALGQPLQRQQLELRLGDGLAQGGRRCTSDVVASGLGGRNVGSSLVQRWQKCMVRERSRETVRDRDGGMASPLGHGSEEKRAGIRATARDRRPWRCLGHRRVAGQLSHAYEASDQAPFKWLLRLTGGPSPFSDFFNIFKDPNFEI